MFLSKKLLKQERFYGVTSEGDYTNVYMSMDLSNWTKVASISKDLASYAFKLKRVNGKYFLLYSATPNNFAGKKLVYSDDLVNWTTIQISASGGAWRDIIYANGKYILTSVPLVVTTSTTLAAKILYSSDLVNWYEGTTSTNGGVSLDTNGSNQFAQTTLNWRAGYSTNGIIYTSITSYSGAYGRCVCYGDGNFLITLQQELSTSGTTGTPTNLCLRSTNGGQSYSTYTLPITANWAGAIYTGSRFVIMRDPTYGNYNQYCYGTFSGFSTGTLPNSRRWSGNQITYNNGRMFITAYDSSAGKTYIAESKDGITWTEHETSGLNITYIH